MDIIDDLQRDGLVIVRSNSHFAYGHDAVLLSDFVRARAGERYIDIGTGTGILAILVHAKTGADIVAADIDEECIRMVTKSIALNKLETHITPALCDVRRIGQAELGCFDGAICNPPYFSGGTKSADPGRRASVFEETLNIYDAVHCAGRLVKNGGKLYVCYPAKYIQPLCAAMQQGGFALKRLCLVRSRVDKPPYLALAEGRKGGGVGAELTSLILNQA